MQHEKSATKHGYWKIPMVPAGSSLTLKSLDPYEQCWKEVKGKSLNRKSCFAVFFLLSPQKVFPRLRGKTVHISKSLFHVRRPCPLSDAFQVHIVFEEKQFNQSVHFWSFVVSSAKIFTTRLGPILFPVPVCWLYKLHIVLRDQAGPSTQGPLQPAWLPGGMNVFKDSPSDEGQL